MDGPSVNWKFYEAVLLKLGQKMNYTNLSILVAVVSIYMWLLNQVQKPQTGTSRKFYKVHFRYFMILQPGGRIMKV